MLDAYCDWIIDVGCAVSITLLGIAVGIFLCFFIVLAVKALWNLVNEWRTFVKEKRKEDGKE
jgi:hypothetical protein